MTSSPPQEVMNLLDFTWVQLPEPPYSFETIRDTYIENKNKADEMRKTNHNIREEFGMSWKSLISHSGMGWYKLFKLLKDKFGFKANDVLVSRDSLHLRKERGNVYGGRNDISIIEEGKTTLVNIEVGNLSQWTKVIEMTLTAQEFWWVTPEWGSKTSRPNEMAVITYSGKAEELLDKHPLHLPNAKLTVPEKEIWKEKGLWEREAKYMRGGH